MKKTVVLGLFWALPAMAQSVSGAFVQHKTLTDMGITLTSSGRFEAEAGVGFLWQPLSPAGAGMLLTPTGACQVRETGKVPLPDSAAPVVQTLYTLFNAALSGDEAALRQAFDVQTRDTVWVLTPKESPLKTVITTLTLHRLPDGSPAGVDIQETSGDVTRIEFQKVIKGGHHALSCAP